MCQTSSTSELNPQFSQHILNRHLPSPRQSTGIWETQIRLGWLASKQSPPPPKVYHHTRLFIGLLGTELRTLCLYSTYLTTELHIPRLTKVTSTHKESSSAANHEEGLLINPEKHTPYKKLFHSEVCLTK